MRLILLLSTLFALTLGGSAYPFACDDYGPLSTGVWQFTDGTPEGTFYLDDRDFVLGNGFWLFQESNGIWTPKAAGVVHASSVPAQADLQPNYCPPFGPDVCLAECYGDWFPDRLLF